MDNLRRVESIRKPILVRVLFELWLIHSQDRIIKKGLDEPMP